MVYSTRRFVLSLVLRYFVLVFFSPFSIAITPLGEEREIVLVLFIRLLDLRFSVLSVSSSSWFLGRVRLWLWHSLDFPLTSFFLIIVFSNG